MYVVYHMDDGRDAALFFCFIVFLFGVFRLNARDFTVVTLYTLAAYALVISLLMQLRPQAIHNVPLEWMSWLALAGLLHLVRLGRWAGDRTWRERLVLILHVGYAFVPLGFLLNAASAFGLVPTGAGVHAWMVGAAGTMTLAVMSRATLGHSGQQLIASIATQGIYAAIIVAALARICAALEPDHSELLLHVAAFAWAAAFFGFAVAYAPFLVGHDPRRRRKAVSSAT